MQQQVVEQSIGFVCSVDGGEDATAALPAIGAAEGLGNRWGCIRNEGREGVN